MALLQLSADLEGAQRLDLVLRRAVPDRIGAPEHTLGADMLEQLAERVRRLGRIAHHDAPRRAELGIDIGVRRHAVVGERLDQRIDAARGVARIPEDRHAVGTIGDMSVVENAILEQYRSRPFNRMGFLRWC